MIEAGVFIHNEKKNCFKLDKRPLNAHSDRIVLGSNAPADCTISDRMDSLRLIIITGKPV